MYYYIACPGSAIDLSGGSGDSFRFDLSNMDAPSCFDLRNVEINIDDYPYNRTSCTDGINAEYVKSLEFFPSVPLPFTASFGNAIGHDNNGRCSYDATGNIILPVLPVELIYFSGKIINSVNVQLEWETASELNNEKFEVEKSEYGIEFKKIGEVLGKGTTVERAHYRFEVKGVFYGTRYYRLKQIDFDGKFKYSDVIAIKSEHGFNKLQVYPNPSQGNINIQINNPSNQHMKILIRNNLGMKVWESKLIKGKPYWQREIKLERAGFYYVSVQIGEEIQYEKVIISDK